MDPLLVKQQELIYSSSIETLMEFANIAKSDG